MKSLRSFHLILAVALFALTSFALVRFESPAVLPVDETLAEAAQEPAPSRLSIIVPDRDSVTVSMGRHRIAANTEPGSRAFLNDDEVTVYPNGAFAGLVEVPTGHSTSEIRVILPEKDTLKKHLHFYRPEPVETLPRSPLAISRRMMLPDRTLSLDEGDELEIRFKGSPGARAFFSIEGVVEDEPMQELPPFRTGGIEGVYSGHYVVRDGDEARNVPVTFTLMDENHQITAQTGTTLSLIPGDYPKVAKIIGRRPYLNLEPTTDRLGGNPAGYLDKGVHLEITGRFDRFYRIRLSDERDAYIPRFFVEMLPDNTPPPRAESGTVSVIPGSGYDVVSVSLSQRLPYISTMTTTPNTIELDIFGADPGNGGIIHRPEAIGIRRVEREHVSNGHLRLVIHLEHDQHWGYHAGYGVGNSLHVRVSRPPRITSGTEPLNGVRIAVDAGHGGNNTGALGSSGAGEKDIVLDIANRVRSRLEEKGAGVYMTRDSDINISLTDRSEAIIDAGAHIMVSIHANSIGYATDPMAIHGTSIYYRHNGFRPLARIMHRHMLQLPLRDFGLFDNFHFTLNRLTEMPNVLIETAFISNPEDEIKLLDPDFREEIASRIVNALEEYIEEYADRTDPVKPDESPM